MAMQLSRAGSVLHSVRWEAAGPGRPGARKALGRNAGPYGQLPLALLATASIVVPPSLLATALIPPHGATSMLAAAVAAMTISLAIASAEAAAWKRWRRAGELMFSDLMLWGWARRWSIERRLRNVRASYEAARRTGKPVRIELLEGLSRLLEARSAYTHGHCRRVARHAEAIARAMELAPGDVARIRTAAAVHDLGKVYTPTEILDKTGPLSEEEYAVIKRHAADGADMLSCVGDARLAAIVRHHHERLDGSGYPDGLAGGEISLGARIVAVADTFDAITSDRPYRRAHSHRAALEILSREAGAQLDEEVVAVFMDRYASRRSVASLAFASALLTRALVALRPVASGLAGSGTSIAGLGPALGAAGVLALAMPHHGASSAGAHRTHALASLRRFPRGDVHGSARTAIGGHAQLRRQSPAGAPRNVAGSPTRRLPARHVRRSGPGVAPRPSTPSPSTPATTPAGRAVDGQSSASTTASSGPPPRKPSSEPGGGSGGTAQEAIGKVGEATSSLPVSTPSVTTPSVTTPSVTTPSGTTPTGAAPSTTVPSVTTPSVTVPGKG